MSKRIKLSLDDIQYISLFEGTTRAKVKDCMVDDKKNRITFVVSEGQAGIAIGKAGINIKKLEEKLNKKIEVIEFSDDPVKFLANLFRPLKINNAYVSEKSTGDKVIHAAISKDNMGMMKAKMGRVKELLQKYYNFQDVIFS